MEQARSEACEGRAVHKGARLSKASIAGKNNYTYSMIFTIVNNYSVSSYCEIFNKKPTCCNM